jgi:MFS family permease
VVFDLGTLLHEFFDVSSSNVPYLFVIFALSNFLGPLTLGRLFDTVGRKPMIAFTYLGSAAIVAVLGILLLSDSLETWSFMALLLAAFFLASAGASSAYLTVSEIFPMETRALAIAFFFAVGTAAGGIAGPQLFGEFIHSGDVDLVALGFFIGAAAMALGGFAELFLGVSAEQKSLEDIAAPLTAEDAEAEEPPVTPEGERIRQREERRRERARTGRRRYQPGPGTSFYSPGMLGTGASARYATAAGEDLDREIEAIVRVLEALGAMQYGELGRRLDAPRWGPRRYRAALREAIDEGRVRRLPGGAYGPVATPASNGPNGGFDSDGAPRAGTPSDTQRP